MVGFVVGAKEVVPRSTSVIWRAFAELRREDAGVLGAGAGAGAGDGSGIVLAS
jgi:hypothetical protein